MEEEVVVKGEVEEWDGEELVVEWEEHLSLLLAQVLGRSTVP